MTIYTQALELVANGNQDAAWELAKTDSSMNESVTKNKWIEFATKAIESTKAQAKVNAEFAW